MNFAILIYFAFSLKFVAFLFRDELVLRGLVVISSIIYVFYYYAVSTAPLWDAVVTNATLAVLNVVMIGIVLLERTTLTMPAAMADAYRNFNRLTPGQFRRLYKAAARISAEEPTVLTTEAAPVGQLFFVLTGDVAITKGTTEGSFSGPSFIGEIAYLRKTPASATVTVQPGTDYLAWDHAALRKLTRRSGSFSNAMLAQFNADLIEKVAASQPASRAALRA